MIDPMMLMALSGLGGGGGTEVSQSASNSTSVSLTSVLSNQGEDLKAGVSAQQSAGASAGANAPQPVQSPLSFPNLGFSTPGAEANAKSADSPAQEAKIPLPLALAGIALGGYLLFFGGGKKKRK